jgi:hypothetical protein
MSSTHYEELYGVKLLDDLHNYFPALLYDTARFQSVRDVLGYITQSTRNRFDLFSFGQRNYMQTSLPPQSAESPPPPMRQRGAAQARAVDVSEEDVPFHQPRPMNTYADVARGFGGGAGAALGNSLTASVELFTDDFDMSSMRFMNLVNLLNGLDVGRPPLGVARGRGAPMEDVVVNATAEQIEAASTREIPEADTICSICQDAIATNEMGRNLNHCGHTFHIRCIDTWFSRNVHCPICRHDIREIGEEVN